MKSIRTTRRAWAGAFAIATAALLAPTGLSAQDADADRDRDCVCVDRNGDPIENCTCFRAFSLDGNGFTLPMDGDGFFWVRRAQIGVNITLDQGADVDARGARIEMVADDSPAEEGGLREGDIVTHVDGRSVLEPLEDERWEESIDEEQSVPVQRFMRLVGSLEPGEAVEFRVLRDGAARTLVIEPEEAEGVSFLTSTGPAVSVFRGEPGTFEFRGDVLRDRMMELENRLGENGIRLHALQEGELRDRMRMTEEQRERMRESRDRTQSELRILEERLRSAEAPNVVVRPRAWSGGDEGEGVVRFFGNGEFAFSGDPCAVRTEGADGFSLIVNGRECTDGVEMVDLNPGLGSYFGTDEGVLVTEVHEGSTLGLQAGDVLLAIDGRVIEDRDEAFRVLRSYELDDELRLRVRRDDREVEVLGRRREAR